MVSQPQSYPVADREQFARTARDLRGGAIVLSDDGTRLCIGHREEPGALLEIGREDSRRLARLLVNGVPLSEACVETLRLRAEKSPQIDLLCGLPELACAEVLRGW